MQQPGRRTRGREDRGHCAGLQYIKTDAVTLVKKVVLPSSLGSPHFFFSSSSSFAFCCGPATLPPVGLI